MVCSMKQSSELSKEVACQRIFRREMLKAFTEDSFVTRSLYDAHYDFLFLHYTFTKHDITRMVKAEIINAAKVLMFDEDKFKCRAARIGKIIAHPASLTIAFSDMVIEAWAAAQAQAHVRQVHAATVIQRHWRVAVSNPGYTLCMQRIMREWLELIKM